MHSHSSHSHGHHHHGMDAYVMSGRLGRVFLIGIALNLLYVIVEGAAGMWYGSMGLLSDAGHNLSDVASLVIALVAFRLAARRPTARYTYGYRRATIEASFINALILGVAIILIYIESVGKLIHPESTNGDAVAWVAAAGIVVNGVTAWLFVKDKGRDLNVKGAFLHMLADTLVSVGVVISGIVIHFTGWNVIDPIVGIVIASIIAFSTWRLLRESVSLALDGVPEGIDIGDVERRISEVPGVRGVHHVHIRALSTTMNSLTAHIVIDNPEQIDRIVCDVKNELAACGISHSTIEAETRGSGCDGDCGCAG